jgi:hypothetical protein
VFPPDRRMRRTPPVEIRQPPVALVRRRRKIWAAARRKRCAAGENFERRSAVGENFDSVHSDGSPRPKEMRRRLKYLRRNKISTFKYSLDLVETHRMVSAAG